MIFSVQLYLVSYRWPPSIKIRTDFGWLSSFKLVAPKH
jgi:hypothetical protein